MNPVIKFGLGRRVKISGNVRPTARQRPKIDRITALPAKLFNRSSRFFPKDKANTPKKARAVTSTVQARNALREKDDSPMETKDVTKKRPSGRAVSPARDSRVGEKGRDRLILDWIKPIANTIVQTKCTRVCAQRSQHSRKSGWTRIRKKKALFTIKFFGGFLAFENRFLHERIFPSTVPANRGNAGHILQPWKKNR